MDSFQIESASGEGLLEFFERTPRDPSKPLERFKVKVIEQDLYAVVRVYASLESVDEPSPTTLFALMASQWRGWQGEMAWGSLEEELSLRCSFHKSGQVPIQVRIRSGSSKGDWSVEALIQTEAGQLETIARQASDFFGEPPQ